MNIGNRKTYITAYDTYIRKPNVKQHIDNIDTTNLIIEKLLTSLWLNTSSNELTITRI